MVTQMTVQEFKLLLAPEKEDPRVDILRDNVGFQNKLKFLKDMGRLSENDVAIVKQFSTERNKLFHGSVFTSSHPVEMPTVEKKRLMALANKASQIVTNRTVGVWVGEGTGDVGNKNVSKPDKPKGVKFTDDLLGGKYQIIDGSDLIQDVEETNGGTEADKMANEESEGSRPKG